MSATFDRPPNTTGTRDTGNTGDTGDTGAPLGRTRSPGADDEDGVVRLALHCIGRVARLLARRQLHLHRGRVGESVQLPDGRRYVVYRESSSSEPCDGEPITMTMWFHLRGVPAGARFRAFLFERESILNTLLYAGFEGYRTKLWTVNEQTNDYAGFYTWRGRRAAERYARYAMTMLRPISVPGSLGCQLDDDQVTPSWSRRRSVPA